MHLNELEINLHFVYSRRIRPEHTRTGIYLIALAKVASTWLWTRCYATSQLGVTSKALPISPRPSAARRRPASAPCLHRIWYSQHGRRHFSPPTSAVWFVITDQRIDCRAASWRGHLRATSRVSLSGLQKRRRCKTQVWLPFLARAAARATIFTDYWAPDSRHHGNTVGWAEPGGSTCVGSEIAVPTEPAADRRWKTDVM